MALVFVKVVNVHLGAGRWMARGGMQDQGEVGTLQQGIATGPAQLIGLNQRAIHSFNTARLLWL
jgi:hypothetical protein